MVPRRTSLRRDDESSPGKSASNSTAFNLLRSPADMLATANPCP